MREIPEFNRFQAKVIVNYYANPLRTSGEWSYQKAAGFLFAVSCEPDLVPPDEWLEVLLEDGAPGAVETAPFETVLDAFLSLYNWIESGVQDGRPELPIGCEQNADAMADLDAASPVSEWSQGFVWGHSWAGTDEWLDGVTESLDHEIGTVLMCLSFFAARVVAEDFYMETRTEEASPPFEEVTATMSRLLPDALGDYARFCLALRQALEEARGDSEPLEEEDRPPSRNAPCPCGSGKKFKACCGRK